MAMTATTSTASKVKKAAQSFSFIAWKKEQIKKGAILTDSSDRLFTTWYAEQVVKGNILESEKNILSAKRHLNDLKRQGTEDFPWIFVEDDGHRPVRFIEKYCKPSKGDLIN